MIDANEAALLSGCATGFQFSPINGEALADAIDRACDLYATQPTWRRMVRKAMKQPVGWERSATAYSKLYKTMLDSR